MTNEKQDDRMEIAKTIIQQLGNRRFIAMTEAHNFIALARGVEFRIPKTKKQINLISIRLDDFDTYVMKFQQIRMKHRGSFEFEIKNVAEYSGVYFDQLQPLFTSETGLDTHL